MPHFEVKNLNYTIESHHLLKDISFKLERGSLTLLCGQNGSGKSLLLKCIKGLINQDSGTITLDEKTQKRSDRMRNIGLVFQDSDLAIVGQTVYKDIAFGLENLNYKKEMIDEKVESLLKEFSLTELKNHHPMTLSGGEKRKVSLIGVLAMEVKLILLDEPFANLDYPSTLLLLNTLKKLKNSGYSLLIVSHEVEKLIALTDHLIILNKGRVVYDGMPEEGLEGLKKNQIYVPNIPFEEMTWLT